MINEKQFVEQEMRSPSLQPLLPIAPPRSKTFFDGFAAALWGTILGSGASAIAAVSLVLHLGGGPTQVYTALGIMTFLTVFGCFLHLSYMKQYHSVSNTRNFFNILALGFILGLLMFLILPGVIVSLFLWNKFSSIQEETPFLTKKLNSPMIISQINSDDKQVACR